MKHGDIIKKLTIEEKCSLLSGKDFWSTVSVESKGIPSRLERFSSGDMLPDCGDHRELMGS